MHLPFLKDEFHGSSRELFSKMETELERKSDSWSKRFEGIVPVSRFLSHLRIEKDLLKYCRVIDEFYDDKKVIIEEKTKINKLIEQGARLIRVKLAIQKVQEYKAILDKSLESRRNLLKPDSSIMLSNAEKIATEMNPNIQQAMTDALN